MRAGKYRNKIRSLLLGRPTHSPFHPKPNEITTLSDQNILKSYEGLAFELGLAVRVFLIVVALPLTYAEWFLPFLTHSLSATEIDLWSDFLEGGGDPQAFPYGPIYLAVFSPLTIVGELIGANAGAALGLGFTVLILDGFLFLSLRELLTRQKRFWITYTYWWSPIVLYCCYWHGQLDVLPVLILTIAFLFLHLGRLRSTGLALGLATVSKFSMGAALPFFGIFFWGDRRYRGALLKVLFWLGVGLLTTVPFLYSASFRQMAFSTPETLKVFSLSVSLTDTVTVYILPLALVSLAYLAWRVQRFNERGLFAFVALAFFLLFLLTPASPGWAMWVLPFLALHMARGGETDLLLGTIFSVSVVLYHLLVSSGPMLFQIVDLSAPLVDHLSANSRVPSILFSVVVLTGAMVGVQIFRSNIYKSHFFELARKPILVSIAGESGSGKDTLSNALTSLFGAASTVSVSGDDYHHWDRRNPMWQAFTHLHPHANDLPAMEKDLLALQNGQSVRVRHYDHGSGRMTKPRKLSARDVILFSGLHALYFPSLRTASDLSIYLDMEESLRRRFKIKRDMEERGHLLETIERSLELREKDSEEYIRPQRKDADLVLRLMDLRASADEPELAVRADFAFEFDTNDLYRIAVALGICEVKRELDENGTTSLSFFGPFDAGAVRAAAQQVAPHTNDMLSLEPEWPGDVTGVMELCILLCLEQKRFKGQSYDG